LRNLREAYIPSVRSMASWSGPGSPQAADRPRTILRIIEEGTVGTPLVLVHNIEVLGWLRTVLLD
jgi:hypothetical protein